jgi:hypothetical protein
MDISQKALLVGTTNSQGWLLATRLGEEILKELESTALNCEDDDKTAGLVREARASRKFWERWLSYIDNAKNPEVKDEFIEVSM